MCASPTLVERRGKETKAGIPADERGGRGRAGAAHTPSCPGLPHRPAFPGCLQRRGRASLIACTWLLLSIQSKRDHKPDITNSEELFLHNKPLSVCLFGFISEANSGGFENEQGSWPRRIAGGTRHVSSRRRWELSFGVLKIALQRAAGWAPGGAGRG